jgi:hypothetical protein
MSWELNCPSNGFSCNFLDVAMNPSPRDIFGVNFNKLTQLQYAGIDMIFIPRVHSNLFVGHYQQSVLDVFFKCLRCCGSKFSAFL